MANPTSRERLAALLAVEKPSADEKKEIGVLTAALLKENGAKEVKGPTIEACGVKMTARPHTWASGTRGYLGSFKGEVNGERVQVNVNIFVVGSKGEGAK